MNGECTVEDLKTGLAHCTGGDEIFKHGLSGLLYTEGVRYLAENAGAYWLIDAIASYQRELRGNGRMMEFQLWTLTVNRPQVLGEPMAVLECFEDSGLPATVTQEIEYTDFPLDSIKLYVENGTILLPNEH